MRLQRDEREDCQGYGGAAGGQHAAAASELPVYDGGAWFGAVKDADLWKGDGDLHEAAARADEELDRINPKLAAEVREFLGGVKAGTAGKDALQTINGNDIITVEHTELTGKPNSITQEVTDKGGINRNYYDGEGNQYKQISNNNHGRPKTHTLGKNGEHAHNYIYKDGVLIDRPKRELTDEEREENGDIL